MSVTAVCWMPSPAGVHAACHLQRIPSGSHVCRQRLDTVQGTAACGDCMGHSCPQWCAGPWHAKHPWTGLHLFRAVEEELWWHLERSYGIAAFSETISKWFTLGKKKKKKRHTDCAPLQKSSILLRSFTYYTGWTWQRFSKRLYWRAEQEPARLQKKCQPQKINTTLHHV